MHAFVLCTDGVDVIEGEKERDKKGRGGKEGKKERKARPGFHSLKFRHPWGGVSTPPKDIYITQFSNRFRDGK